MKRLIACCLIAAAGTVVGVAPAQAAVQKFRNCTAVHKKYPGGIARPGGHQKPGQPPLKRKPYVNRALYNANSSLDRDKDSIACEVS